MSSQRERQRERERNQRQLTTPSMANNSNNSLFGEPIKQEHDDETTKRIKSTLGDFDSVQLLLINDPKPLLGISTREITRIKGHKAKIEQILSEMKHTLEPITALDDFSDETNAKYSNSNNNNNNNNSEHIVNNNSINNNNNNNSELQRNLQSNDRNNRRINSNSEPNKGDFSPDDKTYSNHNKVSNSKKRKSSKSDAENGLKTNGTKLAKSTSSSNSSESSSNSSSISSSSSESSDEEEEEEEKESDNISLKQEEIPSSRQETPKASTAPQPEIATWDLETFMDKKITTTTTTSTTVSSNSTTTIKTSSYDNISDVIDKVAKGELGDNMSSSSSSPSPTPKKRRKSTQSNDITRNENSKQTAQKTPKHNQQNNSSGNQQNNSSANQDYPFSPEVKEMKFDKQKTSLTPKSLIVSIKLMLLKRVPGQSYPNNCNSISSNSSNRSNSSVDAIGNDDNNSNLAKSKNTLNSKVDKKSVKSENVNKTRDTSKSNSNSSSKSCSSKQQTSQQQQDNDSRNSEHISSSNRDNTTSSTSSSVKLEPQSPPQGLPSLCLPPPPTTTAVNMSATLLRTPPEISATVGQPDDFLSAAKRLKHAADREMDRTVQACRYLEAVLYFILTGNAMEQRSAANEIDKVCTMYKETLNLIRQITNKFAKSRSSHSADIPTTDHKLTTLSYRCQSLLYLKLSRLKSKEIRDNNKTIQQQTQESNSSSNTTTIQTSLLNAFQRQLFLLQQYHTAHDLWQQADHLIEKHPSCKAFFVALDNECGSLSLNSTFDHLVHYVRTGLQILK